MALEIHVSGPGLDATRRLAAGDPQLVLGRDTECDVCLPDPQRTVSRRHLALWAEGDELHFHVVSSVNGIEMAFGEAPPGARGVLPAGQSMKVGDYVVVARQVAGETKADTKEADPWAALQASAETMPLVAAPPPEDDPFGADWGFTTTFGPVNTAGGGGGFDAASMEAGEVASFFQGLGVEAGTMSKGELEAMGRLVRLLVLGVLDLHATVTGVKKDLRSEDRTMMATKDNNPLKTAWPAETKLKYLFGGRLAAVGFVSAERAMREVLVDLVAHNTASAAAARAAIEGTLRDLAPATLRTKLLGEGTKLFEGTRAWDAYSKWYEEQGADMQKWAQRQLDRHFTEAYLRESLRIRRETRKA
ncbi:type VI secretion system-associated FHA domain protein [Ramlibacter sp. PS4R-6]|uniref:type VI secretion system-associated FHA domain protein n=1 Tax=Ramlibacter sp. PS4R-6 TaxID=3133438 RepID=UPI0030B1327B